MRGDLFIPLDMPISREWDLNPRPTVYLPAAGKSRRWDLNPRPTVYKTVALPLSYFGIL